MLCEIDSFGDVAAEDDPVLEYFVTTDAVDRIAANEQWLVLGRKGAGKTAIVRYFSEGGHKNSLSKALNLRSYPWGAHATRRDFGASEMEAYVASWEYLIAVQCASLVLERVAGARSTSAGIALEKFLEINYGGITPELKVILQPARLTVAGAALEPTLLGNKLGSISLDRGQGEGPLGVELSALSDAIRDAVAEVVGTQEMPNLLLHFDELDQGLSELDDQRKEMLTGLLLAARNTRRYFTELRVSVNPVVYLRIDLWRPLQFSDKNKIAQTSSLHLEWTSTSLKDLINARISAKLSADENWDTLDDGQLMRGSQTKWRHILVRSFLRPRDVIKFLNLALQGAKRRSPTCKAFTNSDIIDAREEYSAYLKAELDDELRAHWPQWEEAIQAFRAITTITFSRDAFAAEYEKRKSPGNDMSPDDALRVLFTFSVVGIERRSGYGGSGWVFQYESPEAQWDQAASKFKVHPGLKEFARLLEGRGST